MKEHHCMPQKIDESKNKETVAQHAYPMGFVETFMIHLARMVVPPTVWPPLPPFPPQRNLWW